MLKDPASTFGPAWRRLSVVLAGALVVRQVVRHRRKMPLEGRVALITGGSRGLGLAVARGLAQRGMRIALCARDEKELAAAAEDLRRFRVPVSTFVCDVQDTNAVDRMIADVQARCGGIDLLINDAGIITIGPAETMSIEDFHESMNVNFWGAVNTTLAVVPGMKSRGGGRIVNIGSIGGKMPVPHLATYCASKFAVTGFSGAMHSELAKDGIFITTVSPGLMRTGSPRHAYVKGRHQAEYAWFSLSDGLPGLSLHADRAAKRIIEAAIYGQAEVILGLPAKIASRFYGLMPGTYVELASAINRLLPQGFNPARRMGSESESQLTRSPLGFFNHRAEQQYNQLSPSQLSSSKE